jgi:competence protein ComEA
MSDSLELPPRPQPPRRVGESVTAWLNWFGIGRLIAAGLSVVLVGAGAFWLVRAPAPTPESTLPFAGQTASAAPTLAPPSTIPGTEAADLVALTVVVVHVAGSVERPGVYELISASRIHHAIDAGGGVTPDGDLNGLNLAAPVVDGQRIYVPATGEVDPATVPSVVTVGEAVASGPIDLNQASAVDLQTLPGVGPATATAIIDDRTRNGPFATVDDLDRVPGIGPSKLALLRDLVTV